MASEKRLPIKVVTVNRKAYHDYEILETVEAGLVLTGTEIKSLRGGHVQLRDGYAAPRDGELWLLNTHISGYKAGGIRNHEPTRPRKLLLHHDQLGLLIGKASRKGLTLIPLRVYIKGHLAKVELGLARGRRKYEKREVIAEREAQREIHRAMKRRK